MQARTLREALTLSRELLAQREKRKVIQYERLDDGAAKIITSTEDRIYVPSETGKRIHADDEHYVRFVMGPVGSGKTVLCVQDIVRQVTLMPKWANNGTRRKARIAVIRNTLGELMSTTLQTWLSWFGEMGDIYVRQKPILTYIHTFNDGYGLIELEIIFLALDRPDDVAKLKSLELTGAYMNEASELPMAVFEHLKGRIGRYPSKAFCKDPYRSFVLADTNPPPEDHWIYNTFELTQHPGHILYKQPSGLLKNSDGEYYVNSKADNIVNLPDDYYTRLAQGNTQEFIKVYCLGEYGTVSYGKLVYASFNSDLHVVPKIDADPDQPLYIGYDFGLTPAAVIVQFINGQIRVLREITSRDVGARSFGLDYVLPTLNAHYDGFALGDQQGDPSGANRGQADELSPFGVLREIGLQVYPAATNKITSRIEAVDFFLNRNAQGQPAFIIDRRHCPTLIRGFLRDYIYKRKPIIGEERYKEEPADSDVTHPHDALQYILMKLHGQQQKLGKKPVNVLNLMR